MSTTDFLHALPEQRLTQAIYDAYLMDEQSLVLQLLSTLQTEQAVHDHAKHLVEQVRRHTQHQAGFEHFLQEYDLSTREGILLMCIAEALLRIPDTATADKLLRDKLQAGNWEQHLTKQQSWLVNASTWGLILTNKIFDFSQENGHAASWANRFVAKGGESVLRSAMHQAMKVMGEQFVMGSDISEAEHRSRKGEHALFRYSFDMLGEAALSTEDAERYFQAYLQAIHCVGEQHSGRNSLDKPSISIKLSALHPRYQLSQWHHVQRELGQRLLALLQAAKQHQLTVTIDAEESERLEMSLCLFAELLQHPDLADWSGFGLAVQAYQKRASAVLDWLIQLARQQNKRIPIRLVKGAYWDSEIKRAQELGLSAYPVFTRKQYTDISYQACALKLLDNLDYIYPQFATHNAHTIAFILHHAKQPERFEFQRLYGMGQTLYQILLRERPGIQCRVYAPVGNHKDLLPYLVRRLLENGANSSFINRIRNPNISVEQVIADPVTFTQQQQATPHPDIPLPVDLFAPQRKNSPGLNLFDHRILQQFFNQLPKQPHWLAQPIINGQKQATIPCAVHSPFDTQLTIGQVHNTDPSMLETALSSAAAAYPSWNHTPVAHRCQALLRCADLLEHHMTNCLQLLMFEAGKTLNDSLAEVREAIDFCRYYAQQGERLLSQALQLTGPTGEQNELSLAGRGTFVCISPWNFPLAIFIGQITAALVTGNCVIAKPAEQTPLIASLAVELLHQAGIPSNVLHLLPGDGPTLGKALISDNRIKGVAFTGSYETAKAINLCIAQRHGEIIPLIAETGGLNAMIADSSALAEQMVLDAVHSAFNSAGQRCSALRVLFVQTDIADKVINLLRGAMAQLHVGDPRYYQNDIGPVIDHDAHHMLSSHIRKMHRHAKLIYETPIPTLPGHFIAPICFEISHLGQLQHEVFGPVLHVIRYPEAYLDDVIAQIKQSGYGLTLGIHSRINRTIQHILQQVHVGNVYINRNMIGAVVGVQPFGGEGLSGTGPKAGGPYYLHRFCSEHTVSTNIAAVGGNTELFAKMPY